MLLNLWTVDDSREQTLLKAAVVDVVHKAAGGRVLGPTRVGRRSIVRTKARGKVTLMKKYLIERHQF